MHTILRRAVLSTVLAALFAVSPAAMPLVLAAGLVSFSAVFTEQDTFIPCSPPTPTTICAIATGTGQGSPIGQATETVHATINLASNHACLSDTSTGTLTAANGDQIFLTATGKLCPSASIDFGTYSVTGGTGRFAGASGRGAFVTRVLSPTTSQSTYTGTLSTPGSENGN